MAAELLTDASRALDANANPYAGAKWYFYATGTLTPQSVYTTATLSVAHANPVVADAGGKFPPIYFDASLQYRGILENDSGTTTIYDIDPINSGILSQLSGSGGAALVGGIQSGTGAILRTQQEINRERLSVLDFVDLDDADHAPGIQNAIDAAVDQEKDLWFPAATYVVNSTLLKEQSFFCPNFYAEAGTILDGEAIANGATLKIKGGSGQLAAAEISGFRFRAGAGVNSTGLEIADQCGVEYENCIFETGTWGVTYHNEGTGGFTEYCVGRRCSFLADLTDASVRYRVTGGNNSFHGSGLTDHSTIQLTGADNAIKIESGAMVYNAPLSFQVWVTGSSKVVVNNASTERQTTIGDITIEVFGAESYATAPELFSGSGTVITHSGNVVSFGTSWLGPKCRLVGGERTVLIGPEGGAANGSITYKQSPYTLLKELSDDAGGTVIFNLSDVAIADVAVQIEAPNYDYRYKLSLGTGLFGAGNVEEINNPVSFNVSAAGPPTFSVDADGDFIITNTNYDDTYTAFVTVHPMGPARSAVLSSGADYKPS